MKKVWYLLIIPLAVFTLIAFGLWTWISSNFGKLQYWSNLGDIATAAATYCVVITIYLLVINWLMLKEQNSQLIVQSEDLKRSTDAQVIKTAIDILQAQDIREARDWVYTNIRDNKDKKNDVKEWDKADIEAAEKVCQTFDSVAMLVSHKTIPEEFIYEWGDTMMQSFSVLNKLINYYEDERGQMEVWSHFKFYSIKYAQKQKQVLLAKPEKSRGSSVKRAQVIAECFLLMGMEKDSDEIKAGYKINKTINES